MRGDTGIIQKIIYPQTRGDRITFDLVLPVDCVSVTGMATDVIPGRASTSYFKSERWPHNTAGHLSLRWANPGDIFFQAKVDWAKSYEMDYVPLGVKNPAGAPHNYGWLSTNGPKPEPLEIIVPGKLRLIRGYYKDVLNQVAGADDFYIVFIYLYYQKKR